MATILVVDDSLVIRRVLDLTLKKAGHAAVALGDGLEALEWLEQAKADLAIIDLDMPVMDGLTLLRKLRANERYRSLPVIMLTGSGQENDRLLAANEGVDAFLTKPASSPELIEIVNQLLGANEQSTEN